jgi:hypothetical protein
MAHNIEEPKHILVLYCCRALHNQGFLNMNEEKKICKTHHIPMENVGRASNLAQAYRFHGS